MEILLLKKTEDKDLSKGLEVCYKNIDGVFNKLGKITDIIEVDGVKNYIINTSFGSYTADELKLIKEPKNYWGWTEEDKKKFEEENYLDHGKWVFWIAGDGKYEAIMHGLYMHVFANLEDLMSRENEIDHFEYCPEISEENDGTTAVNSKGETRDL